MVWLLNGLCKGTGRLLSGACKEHHCCLEALRVFFFFLVLLGGLGWRTNHGALPPFFFLGGVRVDSAFCPCFCGRGDVPFLLSLVHGGLRSGPVRVTHLTPSFLQSGGIWTKKKKKNLQDGRVLQIFLRGMPKPRPCRGQQGDKRVRGLDVNGAFFAYVRGGGGHFLLVLAFWPLVRGPKSSGFTDNVPVCGHCLYRRLSYRVPAAFLCWRSGFARALGFFPFLCIFATRSSRFPCCLGCHCLSFFLVSPFFFGGGGGGLRLLSLRAFILGLSSPSLKFFFSFSLRLHEKSSFWLALSVFLSWLLLVS